MSEDWDNEIEGGSSAAPVTNSSAVKENTGSSFGFGSNFSGNTENQSQHGFGKGSNFSDRPPRSNFDNNRDNEGGSRFSGGGRFNNRDSENGGSGFRERRDGSNSGRSNGHRGNFSGGGGSRGFNDRSEGGGERRSFGGNRDGGDRNFSGGGSRGFNDRSEGGDNRGERRNFGGNRDGGDRNFSGGGGGGNFSGDRFKKTSNEGNEPGMGFKPRSGGDNENGEEVRREKYIPPEIVETEDSLFQSYSVGINFAKQNEILAQVTGEGQNDVKAIEKFSDANLSDLLLENIKRSKYDVPTPVQKYALPIILSRRDLMACAQTGSGKTAAYVLPIMANILNDGIESSSLMAVQQPQALILSPTRELAIQIYAECRKFSYHSMIKSGILYGGADTYHQLSQLGKGCNILVATPGRLLDVLSKNKVSLEKVKYFVLDEADRMLELGFEEAVRDILTKGLMQQKGERCTFMFSATFPPEIQNLAQNFLNNYLFLTVGVVGSANTDVEQTIFKVQRFGKRDKLVEILNEIGNERTMVFIEHKKQADIMALFLSQKDYPTTSIHGDRLQSQREQALASFKNGQSKIIVCTSVAARGLDIGNVTHVINYDLPKTIDEYVHRIGRTGRCGNIGKAISFFDPDSDQDKQLARGLVRTLMQAKQNIPEWLNEMADNTLGSSYAGTNCTDDMRDKFGDMNIKAPEPAAPAVAANDDEAWD